MSVAGAAPRPAFPTIRSIQTLRAIAALLVVLFHLDIAPMGYTGVDLFFVISGYIMGIIGVRESPRDFITRRLTRIAPLYWAVTLALCAMSLVPGLMRNFQFDAAQLVQSLLFIPYRNPDGQIWPLLIPGWTLNFEMFFYVLFAVGLALRRPLLSTVVLLGGLVVVGAALSPADPRLMIYTNPLILEFAAGLAIAAWGQRISGTVGAILLTCGTALFVLMLTRSGMDEGFARILLAGLPATLIVAGILTVERTGYWPKMRPLETLGDWSYSLYLTHGIVLAFVAKLTHDPLVELVAGLAASIAVAGLVYRIVEKPIDDWFKARRRKKTP